MKLLVGASLCNFLLVTPEQTNITNSSLSAFQEMLHHTRARTLVGYLVSHHSGLRDTGTHRNPGSAMIKLLKSHWTVIQQQCES